MRKIVRNKKGGLKFYFVVVLIVINLKLGLIAMKKVIAPLRGQNESNSFANIAIEEKMHTQHWRLPLDFLEKCWELKESGILPTNHTTFLKPLFPPAPSGQAAEVQDIDLIVEALNAYHSLKTTYYKISGLMSTTHLLQRAEKGDIKLPKEVECLDAEISLEKKKHKKPKVAMVVVVTWPREEHSWVNASLANKEKYARQHGYGIHIVPALEGLGRKAPWSKIPWTLALMPAYDWIWWLDLDTVILNQTIVIEGFIDNSYMAVIGLDMNGLNTGSALYRSSSWTRMMFAEAWTLDKVDKAEVRHRRFCYSIPTFFLV